jgi:hypothetical protein
MIISYFSFQKKKNMSRATPQTVCAVLVSDDVAVCHFLFLKRKYFIPVGLIVVVISRQVAVCRRDLLLCITTVSSTIYSEHWALFPNLCGAISATRRLTPTHFSAVHSNAGALYYILTTIKISSIKFPFFRRVVSEKKEFYFNSILISLGNGKTQKRVIYYLTFFFSSISRQSCNYTSF